MLLFLGLPGFLLFAWLSLPWSLLAIAFWGAMVWLGLRKIELGPLTDGAFVIRGCAVAALLFFGTAIPFLTGNWPDPVAPFAWFAVPVLLTGLAISAYRDHTKSGRHFIAVAAPVVALQVQLMIHGALLWIGHIFSGGSPI
jgi:hypothetical protein